ncbi:MAG TPA: hypothetical protein VKP65_21060 [Rhodothermales bacterium]|nr:hypothetical protein [Rhodothermales bacterium]
MSDSEDKEYRSLEENFDLARALFARENRSEDGRKLMLKQFPDAPEEMCYTLAHHAYTDGASAAVGLLVELELALRNEDYVHLDKYGARHELLYHLYNWLHLEAVMPFGRPALLKEIDDIQEALDRADVEEAKEILEELKDRVEGHTIPPDIDYA